MPCTEDNRSASCSSAPLTWTVNELCTGLFASSPSVAVHVTAVTPIGNVEPVAGLQLTGGVSPLSSVAVGGL